MRPGAVREELDRTIAAAVRPVAGALADDGVGPGEDAGTLVRRHLPARDAASPRVPVGAEAP